MTQFQCAMPRGATVGIYISGENGACGDGVLKLLLLLFERLKMRNYFSVDNIYARVIRGKLLLVNCANMYFQLLHVY